MADPTKDAIDAGAAGAKSAAESMADNAKAATDRMREAGERARDAFNERVVDPARRAGEAMRESGKKVAEGGSTIGLRLIDQAETNAHEAFTAMRQAARAKDLSEVMRIQGDYLREQGSRSMQQAREIGELIAQFGREAVAPMRGGGEGDGSVE
jgi:hypothetical protein